MNRKLLIFSGRSNSEFVLSMTSHLGIELGRLETIRFSDGELSVEIGDNVRGRDVFITQSTSTPCNDHLMELLIAIDALKRASAWRITAVIPYFGYARQDRKLKPRVPITAKLVANLLVSSGANRVLTMDLHSGQIAGFFDIPVDNLMPFPIMLPYFQKKYQDEKVTIISPDAGGVERARIFATGFKNSDIAVIDKRRTSPGKISEMRIIGEVENRRCIIVDDMVDTAGTLTKAASIVSENGAKSLDACCIHPVLSGKSYERLCDSVFDEIVVADTIKVNTKRCSKLKVLSVAPLFAEAIRRINQEDSISTLFK